jgi:hypothetical protein
MTIRLLAVDHFPGFRRRDRPNKEGIVQHEHTLSSTAGYTKARSLSWPHDSKRAGSSREEDRSSVRTQLVVVKSGGGLSSLPVAIFSDAGDAHRRARFLALRLIVNVADSDQPGNGRSRSQLPAAALCPWRFRGNAPRGHPRPRAGCRSRPASAHEAAGTCREHTSQVRRLTERARLGLR